MQTLHQVPWSIIILLCMALGLAPFYPQPHLVAKAAMLFSGTLSRPLDIFDLLFHGSPFILLIIKFASDSGDHS